MNLTDIDDCRENYPFLPAATSKYFCAKINWLWSFWVQIVVNVHIYVQMMETVKSLQNRVKSLEEEVSRRRWVEMNYNHRFCFYRILQRSTGLLSIYLAIYLAVVFFPPWIIYSGRASLFSTSSTIYKQHFWRNSCNRERKMMSIWAQGCLLGNSRGEAPICHGPIIDVGHQMQLHTSAAVTCQSPLCRVSERLSLIPFDFWLIPYTQCIAMWPSAQYGHWRTLSTIREAPSPKFGSGGVFDWNEAKKLQFAVFSNISDVYTKVESVTNIYHKTRKLNRSGSSKPKRHRQEVPKVKVREDVEEGEEGEGVGGVHPDNKHHRAGEPRGDAAEQPCRQKTKKEIENHKNTCRRYPCRISSH